MDDEDYDAIREKNIAERNAFFAEFFQDLKKEKAELEPSKPIARHRSLDDSEGEEKEDYEPPRKRRKPSTKKDGSWKARRSNIEVRRKYNTRNSVKRSANSSDSENLDRDDDSNEPRKKGPRLKVLFPWAIPFEREISFMRFGLFGEDNEENEEDEDQSEVSSAEEDYPKRKIVHKVLKSEYDPDSIPSPDEITEEQLLNIADRSSGKVYCKIRGTSCHQCRQKTLDTKTVCRSGQCIGVRGQFCGPCLRGRYGEEAAVVLKDANWNCPPCRGLCNCSICRTRNGQRPTGILAPVVQEEGFSSVMDYLESGNTD